MLVSAGRRRLSSQLRRPKPALSTTASDRCDSLTLALTPCLAARDLRLHSTQPISDTSSRNKTYPARAASSRSHRSQQSKTDQERTAPRRRRTNGKPLFRLDPANPLLLGSGQASLGESSSNDAQAVTQRSAAISRLHTALEAGNTDDVFHAYIQVPRDSSNGLGEAEGGDGADGAIRSSLTASETRMVLGRLISDTPRLQDGLLRLTSIIAEVRRRRKRALLLVERAESEGRYNDLLRHTREAHEWDRLLSTSTMNALISYTGRCVRASGPVEVDEALSILLDGSVDIANSSSATARPLLGTKGTESSLQQRKAAVSNSERLQHAVLGPRLYTFLDRQKSIQRDLSADRVTYNTLLDIVSRSVHRFMPQDASRDQETADDDELDPPLSDEPGTANRLATNMERLGIQAQHGDYTVDTAFKIFQALLDRMRLVSKLTPDKITYNIILNMYCRLGRWDLVKDNVQSMIDRDILDTADVNAIIWRWARGAEGRAERAHRVRQVGSVYAAMRNNLLQLERQKHRFELARSGNAGTSSSPTNHAGAGSARDRHEDARTYAGDLGEILHIDRLPRHIIPDRITYTLLTKLQTFCGLFGEALSTFRDMVATPETTVQRQRDGTVKIIGPRSAGDRDSAERLHPPHGGIFQSFFRGYAKHGQPMQLVWLDESDPLKSEWEPYDREDEFMSRWTDREAEAESLWNVKTYGEIFDAFMKLKPPAPDDLPSSSQARRHGGGGRRGGQPNVVGLLAGQPWPATLPDGTLAETDEAQALHHASSSVLSDHDSLQLPSMLTQRSTAAFSDSPLHEASVNAWYQARRAPSDNDLFFILTSLRRVSGDNARWTLAMWQKVEDKFGPDLRFNGGHEATTSRTRAHALEGHVEDARSRPNREGWTGFRKNARLRHVLQHLESMR